MRNYFDCRKVKRSGKGCGLFVTLCRGLRAGQMRQGRNVGAVKDCLFDKPILCDLKKC